MSIGALMHSGFYSYCTYDDLKEWFILTQNNQTIVFKDTNNQQLHLNSLFIEAENTPLYININGYILYIPANESRNCDFEKIGSIQVMGNLGQKIRFSGQYF